jgi:hypothetical protein
VYDEFVAVDYTDEGNRFFYNWIDPVRIAERQRNNRSILIARQDSELAGMIEIRDNNTISLLLLIRIFSRKGSRSGSSGRHCHNAGRRILISQPFLSMHLLIL